MSYKNLTPFEQGRYTSLKGMSYHSNPYRNTKSENDPCIDAFTQWHEGWESVAYEKESGDTA